MFRGVGLVTFRRMGLTEGRVALYSSLAFGAVHLSNALGTGTNAIAQAIVVCFAGYLLYLTRRWAGAIWLAMPVHLLAGCPAPVGPDRRRSERLPAVAAGDRHDDRPRRPALATPEPRRTGHARHGDRDGVEAARRLATAAASIRMGVARVGRHAVSALMPSSGSP
jgi:hypothetical protein